MKFTSEMTKSLFHRVNFSLFTFSFLLFPFSFVSLRAQSPEKMSYQAVVRDASDDLVISSTVGMQISILQGSSEGTAVYVETHAPSTNANGLVTIEIGAGTVVSGNFATIDWSSGPYFLKTETDPAGGTNFTITGTSQLLSVPYALHAKTAEYFNETDPVFGASVAGGITGTDTANWSNKLDSYNETQNLADVAAINNSVNTQLKNVTDPTDPQDAVTKAYVDAIMTQLYEQGAIRVRDNDGNYYNTVKIGDQIWMAENLKTTMYNDGTAIPYVPDTIDWSNLTTDAYCWYANWAGNKDPYGALYNWFAINTGKLCPAGWHVPSYNEWAILNDYLDPASSGVAGGKLKETGTVHWNSPNTNATNESGFTALPGGFRPTDGKFSGLRYNGYWWSSTEYSTTGAWHSMLYYDSYYLNYWNTNNRKIGFSVRCLKD